MTTFEQIKISICIPAYNDAEAFLRALDSVFIQKYINFECIISDDSTTSDIEEAVAQKHDPRLIYVRNIPPLGIPYNWNAALMLARGEIRTLLHQDDFYSDPFVFNIIVADMMATRAKIAVCGHRIWRNGQLLGKYTEHEGQVRNFLRQYPQRSLVVNRIGHPSVVFFHADCQGILFDEELRYFLDTEWYARLWKCSKKVIYVPHASVGIEFGRKLQLSQRYLEHMPCVFRELQCALQKCKARPLQCVLANARLFASHIRHLLKKREYCSIRLICDGLTLPQKIVFCVFVSFFLLHMVYRFLYKNIIGKPWG